MVGISKKSGLTMKGWFGIGKVSIGGRFAILWVILVGKLYIFLGLKMDINGFVNIDIKEGIIVDIDRVGLFCNENSVIRVLVVKKLFVELDSKGGMFFFFEKIFGLWIDICMSEFNRLFFN